MLNRDFFAFCISLQPLERRALGKLSEVRHLAAEETVYAAGDPSDALYIISRGMVEVVPENSPNGAARTYLSRGDIFGDVEVLSGLPRTHLVRSCDGASLQAFQVRDFPELQQRVPAFFRYLCERLASRLLEARDLAVSRSHCRELSGSLSQFDLVTIYQTITNSSQTGELSIRDERGNLQAAFWFECGQPRSGHFGHLTGEEAFVQLFLETDLRSSFSFESGAVRPAPPDEQFRIARNRDEMLFSSLQSRDELQELKNELSDPTVLVRRAKSRLGLDEISDELRPVVARLWNLSLAQPLPLPAIYAKCSVSELKIYQTVRELLRTGHFELTTQLETQKVA